MTDTVVMPDQQWLEQLEDAVTVLYEATQGFVDVDPRVALAGLLAVGAAWLETMG